MTNRNRLPRTLLAIGISAGLASACSTTSAPSQDSTTTSTTALAAPSPSSTSSATTEAAKTLSLTLTGKRIDPQPGIVTLKTGETLRLTVTSDHDDELHPHGFDKEAQLTAGKPTTLDLSTNQPGTYEVETHHPELRLFKIVVR